MNLQFAKNKNFVLGAVVFILTTTLGIFTDEIKNESMLLSGFLFLLAIIMYLIVEYFKEAEISTKQKDLIINSILSKAEILKHISPQQKVRSNIFCRTTQIDDGQKRNGYKITHYFNMKEDEDYDIFIWENKGVIGESFETRATTLCPLIKFTGDSPNSINRSADYKLPRNPDGSYRTQWIYSTPIKVKRNGRVLYTLSIDGDHEFSDMVNLRESVESVAHKILIDLRSIIPEFRD